MNNSNGGVVSKTIKIRIFRISGNCRKLEGQSARPNVAEAHRDVVILQRQRHLRRVCLVGANHSVRHAADHFFPVLHDD